MRALLESPARAWSLRELADRAETSLALVTKVVRHLIADRPVVGDEVAQGRRARVTATRKLHAAVGAHWPEPSLYVLGSQPPPNLPVGGGTVVSAAVGVVWESRPRAYVRTKSELARVLARSGGAVVSEPAGEWEMCVVDYPFAPGPLPPLIAALELAGSPRGREVLRPRIAPLWADATLEA